MREGRGCGRKGQKAGRNPATEDHKAGRNASIELEGCKSRLESTKMRTRNRPPGSGFFEVARLTSTGHGSV
jgi:hypothetical protein